MAAMRSGLGRAGVTTLTFDYAYIEAGRKAPDRLPRLLEVHEAAYDRLGEYADRIVLAGKSMGGRVGSHLVGGTDSRDHVVTAGVVGLVYLGYPLVPMGKSEPRPADHLSRIDVPQLFVSGTRDRLSPPALVGALAVGLPDGNLHVIDDADHGFHVPKRSGRTDSDVVDELVGLVAAMTH